MKKKFNFLIALLSALIMCVSTLGACSPPIERKTSSAYTVRFYDNYEGNCKIVEVKKGEKVTLPVEFKRPCYNFAGWYLSPDENAGVKLDTTKVIENNLDVFAKWIANGKKSVILKYQDYEKNDYETEIVAGTAFARPDDPEYANGRCEFTGWFTDSACTQSYDFSTLIQNTTVLYAGWNKVKAVIKLDHNYKPGPDPEMRIVPIGDTMEMVTPYKSQHEFLGWFTKQKFGELFDFDKPIVDDITLYAHWERNEYSVAFYPNGATVADGTVLAYSIKKKEDALDEATAVFSNMTYTGHDFVGWFEATKPFGAEEYKIDDLADLSEINRDLQLYAGWDLHEYTVSFNINASDATGTYVDQKVKFSKFAKEPATDPVRSGYQFMGWCKDTAGNSQYLFDTMPVDKDMTLYAKWAIEETHAPITLTYLIKSGSSFVTYVTKTVEYGTAVGVNSPAEPTANNQIFAGWYEDALYTEKFSSGKRLTTDISVYAKMQTRSTFEVEATYLEDMYGQGSSTQSWREGVIHGAAFIRGGDVSNGYFIRELYYNGAKLTFEIDSSHAEEDAVLDLRVSSECYEFVGARKKPAELLKPGENPDYVYNYISGEDFTIWVNQEAVEYDGLYLPMANTTTYADLDRDKTPFVNIRIGKIHLQKGINTIILEVTNNNDHGGTFNAEAPIIDCIYIYSAYTLYMEDYKYYEEPRVVTG